MSKKNKKLTWLFIFAVIMMLLSSGIVLHEIGFFEKPKPLIAAGEVISVSDTSIAFGSYLIGINRSTPVIDAAGNKSDIRKIQVGQRIRVQFTGEMGETVPMQLSDVVEIEILD